jgi:hypothetical protein
MKQEMGSSMQLPCATLEWKNLEVECALIYQSYQSGTPTASHQSPCGIHWLVEFSEDMFHNQGLRYYLYFIIELGLVCITGTETESLGLLRGCYPLEMLVMRTPRTEYDLPEPPDKLATKQERVFGKPFNHRNIRKVNPS